MNSFGVLNKIQEIYQKDQNIIQYLRSLEKRDNNTVEDIMISYDFQAGSYIANYKRNTPVYQNYCSYLSKAIENLNVDPFDTILEAGVGEGTTLGPLLGCMKKLPGRCYGFDISWSKIKYARRFLEELGITNAELFVGDMFCAPLKDNSIDVVYTFHSIEPNGGREKEALSELYRITKQYLVLLEPLFEFADEASRARMLSHGYVTKLYATAQELGYSIIEHRLFEARDNPLNPTGLIIIRKDSSGNAYSGKASDLLSCPITKTDLIQKNGACYSQESLLAYPIIDGIPCLLPKNAIVATKFLN
jgi:ubiquinone/menaquinone biosynthesis C-methylase UbiE/uncharacterized protein YbaR (Trm112 family)